MIRKVLFLSFILFSGALLAQDWWTKTKKESIPPDLTQTTLLVEKFKSQKLDDAPPQAFLDKEDRSEHPLIKKTNNEVEEYNEEMKAIFKNYKFKYELASKKRCEDSLKYPYADVKYILKHEVYLRKYQKNGVNDYFYTYVYYFYDRESKKSYPYIYLFDEKRLKSLEKLVGYLNSL